MPTTRQFLRNTLRKKQWESRRKFFRKNFYPTLSKSPTFTTTSIISSNCWGGMLYHDANQKFLSPTINLTFDALDFIYFANHLNELSQATMREEAPSQKAFPVGLLSYPSGKTIRLYFVHYQSFKEGRDKFWERASRITENIVVVFMTSHLTKEMYEGFASIKYPKLCVYGFSNVSIDPELSSVFLRYPALAQSKRDVLSFKHPFGRKIAIDSLGFDWYSFVFGPKQ